MTITKESLFFRAGVACAVIAAVSTIVVTVALAIIAVPPIAVAFGFWSKYAVIVALGSGSVAAILAALALKLIRKSDEEQWYFRGHQGWCNGYVSTPDAKNVCRSLNNFKSPGIEFDERAVASILIGGTCTAMCLGFISTVREKRKKGYRGRSLGEQVAIIGEQFATSGPHMRMRQAAYNTIKISNINSGQDHSKNKISALVRDVGLRVIDSTRSIDLLNPSQASLLAPEISSLPEGDYFVRMIKPADNEKLEECGHSLVYIKEKELSLFYDPNYGARKLDLIAPGSVIIPMVQNVSREWELNEIRFYKLA